MANTLAGTFQLVRLIARVDRIRLTGWIAILGMLPVVVGSSFAALYDTEAARSQLVASVGSSPGLVALLGPLQGISIGALTVWRVGTIGAVFVGLMAAFTVIRHTRLEEETGRRELLGSTVVGRHAPVTAASLIASAAGAVVGVIAGFGLIGLGEDAAGSLAFGLLWFLTAVVFAGLGALTSQLAQSTGGARGLAGAAIGAFFALRMAGDSGGAGTEWLSWLSPFGWVAKMGPFAGEDWVVIGLFIVLAAVLLLNALYLSGRRDVGAGIFPPRPGPASASAGLSSAFGLSWRLQRRSLLGWAIGVAPFGVMWGSLGDTIAELFEENPQLAEIFESIGGAGALIDVFFNAAMGIVALIVSAYAVGATLTLRSEEEGMRAEPVLATTTPRLNWAGSHIAFGFLGPVLIMALAGAATGLTYGSTTGNVASHLGGLTLAALLYLPAVWLVVGIAVALYGSAPRLTSLAWGALVVFLLLGQLGEILQLPQWALNLSPFTHIPTPPDPVSVFPLIILTVMAALLLVVGLNGFSRRDLI